MTRVFTSIAALVLAGVIAAPVHAAAFGSRVPAHPGMQLPVHKAGFLIRKRQSRAEYRAALRRERKTRIDPAFQDRPEERLDLYRAFDRERVFTGGRAFGPSGHRRIRPEYRHR